MTLRFSPAAIVVCATSAFGGTIFTGTDAGAQAHVKAFTTPALTTEASFFAYDASFTGGVRVAAGDVSGDGLADIVTGAGPAGGPHVKVFDRTSLFEIRSFFAYDAGFTGGVFVAAGDVTGDGRADIVTGTGAMTTNVKVFDAVTQQEVRSFIAFPSFTGGVRVAAGDVNGDGRADLLTATGAGGGELRVFDGLNGAVLRDFVPFAGFTGGLYVAAGDVNNDHHADLIVSTDDSGGASVGHVKVFDGVTNAVIQSFDPYAGFTGSIRVGAGDVNGDGRADVITGTGVNSNVKAFDGMTASLLNNFLPYSDFNGGVFVAGETPVPEPTATSIAGAIGIAMMTIRCRMPLRFARR